MGCSANDDAREAFAGDRNPSAGTRSGRVSAGWGIRLTPTSDLFGGSRLPCPPGRRPLAVPPTETYGEMFTPMPMGALLPEMTRAPALTPTVRAKVSRIRFT